MLAHLPHNCFLCLLKQRSAYKRARLLKRPTRDKLTNIFHILLIIFYFLFSCPNSSRPSLVTIFFAYWLLWIQSLPDQTETSQNWWALTKFLNLRQGISSFVAWLNVCRNFYEFVEGWLQMMLLWQQIHQILLRAKSCRFCPTGKWHFVQ